MKRPVLMIAMTKWYIQTNMCWLKKGNREMKIMTQRNNNSCTGNKYNQPPKTKYNPGVDCTKYANVLIQTHI